MFNILDIWAQKPQNRFFHVGYSLNTLKSGYITELKIIYGGVSEQHKITVLTCVLRKGRLALSDHLAAIYIVQYTRIS